MDKFTRDTLRGLVAQTPTPIAESEAAGIKLICARADELILPPAPAHIDQCSECFDDVWVSASAPPLTKPVCTRCIAISLSIHPETVEVTERQIADLVLRHAWPQE